MTNETEPLLTPEHIALTWADVNWAQSRFLVRASKTEVRWVPIFPELRPYLQEAFERAHDGATHVVTRNMDDGVNLRTQLSRIMVKAGLTPWPKLFHNMRASLETELSANFPMHVVCAWIGNSEDVAKKHYLTVREDDFDRAAKSGAVRCFTGFIYEHVATEKVQSATNIMDTQPMKREDGIANNTEYPRQDSKDPEKCRIFADSAKSAAKRGAVRHFTREQLVHEVAQSSLATDVKEAVIAILG